MSLYLAGLQAILETSLRMNMKDGEKVDAPPLLEGSNAEDATGHIDTTAERSSTEPGSVDGTARDPSTGTEYSAAPGAPEVEGLRSEDTTTGPHDT